MRPYLVALGLPFRSGNGGRGEIVEAGRGKWVDNFKYKPGGNLPKRMWLPASEQERAEAGWGAGGVKGSCWTWTGAGLKIFQWGTQGRPSVEEGFWDVQAETNCVMAPIAACSWAARL